MGKCTVVKGHAWITLDPGIKETDGPRRKEIKGGGGGEEKK